MKISDHGCGDWFGNGRGSKYGYMLRSGYGVGYEYGYVYMYNKGNGAGKKQ